MSLKTELLRDIRHVYDALDAFRLRVEALPDEPHRTRVTNPPDWYVIYEDGHRNLSEAGILALRQLYDAGVGVSDAARRMNVTPSAVSYHFCKWRKQRRRAA